MKQLSLGKTASADNHVAVSSGSAVDQDILGSEAIFSLNCIILEPRVWFESATG